MFFTLMFRLNIYLTQIPPTWHQACVYEGRTIENMDLFTREDGHQYTVYADDYGEIGTVYDMEYDTKGTIDPTDDEVISITERK